MLLALGVVWLRQGGWWSVSLGVGCHCVVCHRVGVRPVYTVFSVDRGGTGEVLVSWLAQGRSPWRTEGSVGSGSHSLLGRHRWRNA